MLLHSLAEFRELIFPVLGAAGAKTVVEIGGEDGSFTRELLAWASEHDARVICIDPAPRPSLEALEVDRRLTLVRKMSLDALGELEPADAYLVDGDHNYFTVRNELELVSLRASEAGRGLPLVILHDVRWPCGRRDHYYNPDAIPDSARHPFTWSEGVVVGDAGVVASGGFRGEGAFATARREGGPRNGVLTAVEDFMAERPDLSLQIVPAVFGLGVLTQTSAFYHRKVCDIVAPFVDSPLVRRLEDNRLKLYLSVIALQDLLAVANRRVEEDDAIRAQLRLRDLEVENRALWARTEELESQLADATPADHVASSRRFRSPRAPASITQAGAREAIGPPVP